jgi:hypothetical protein
MAGSTPIERLMQLAFDPAYYRALADAYAHRDEAEIDIWAPGFSFHAEAVRRGLISTPHEAVGRDTEAVPYPSKELLQGPARALLEDQFMAEAVGEAIAALGRTDYHQVMVLRCIATHAVVHGFVTTKQANELGHGDVSDSTVDRLLREMRDAGLLMHEGFGRDRYFAPSRELVDRVVELVSDTDEPQPVG